MKEIEILKNKLEKMNITSGEYDILVEYFEDEWESFEEKLDKKKHRKQIEGNNFSKIFRPKSS